MKSAKIFLAMAAFIIVVAGVAWGIAAYAGGHFKSSADADAPVTCSKTGRNYQVVIQNNKATPWHTYAGRCDTMTIKNIDNVIRLIAFGPHEHHVAYDGVKERVVGHDQSLTITLDADGTYHFHDHDHDTVTGEFTVKS